MLRQAKLGRPGPQSKLSFPSLWIDCEENSTIGSIKPIWKALEGYSDILSSDTLVEGVN